MAGTTGELVGPFPRGADPVEYDKLRRRVLWTMPSGLYIVGSRAGDRRNGMTMFAADLASTGELRPDHTIDTATDVLWLAMDVRNYDWLVRQRRWPPERFQHWYVDTVAAALLTTPESPTHVESA